MQYIADNVDHNIRTLDGNNTFHGMGIIVEVTPGIKHSVIVPRITASTEELKSIGKIPLYNYRPPSNAMLTLKYDIIEDLKIVDRTNKLDILSQIVWPLKAPMPGWSGLMQLVQNGDFPGKSAFIFLPMIDMNASDLSCIFLTAVRFPHTQGTVTKV